LSVHEKEIEANLGFEERLRVNHERGIGTFEYFDPGLEKGWRILCMDIGER
jgi:hypothetical protein